MGILLRELQVTGARDADSLGGNTVRVLKAAVSALALMAVAVGCSSSEGKDGQQLTAQRENYCTQLGAWQKARNAAGTDTDTPDSSGYDEVGAVAQDAFLAMRPLRDESVGGGRTLAEATVAAMNNSDSEAEGRVVQYCGDVGFETLTR
ncbi:hypothetical protein PUR28_20030 [Streptomyces sp. BE308]|uniref:hypothetical protein n=1 Tax=Streptomyces sp. BE308 TaxID=3002529 RepID=UPI002E778356|nr:hypothetical protein [Streptomyces sp. BE308]MEE1793016.1 hypothetical protein [Streptomyces sp. BE308]